MKRIIGTIVVERLNEIEHMYEYVENKIRNDSVSKLSDDDLYYINHICSSDTAILKYYGLFLQNEYYPIILQMNNVFGQSDINLLKEKILKVHDQMKILRMSIDEYCEQPDTLDENGTTGNYSKYYLLLDTHSEIYGEYYNFLYKLSNQ